MQALNWACICPSGTNRKYLALLLNICQCSARRPESGRKRQAAIGTERSMALRRGLYVCGRSICRAKPSSWHRPMSLATGMPDLVRKWRDVRIEPLPACLRREQSRPRPITKRPTRSPQFTRQQQTQNLMQRDTHTMCVKSVVCGSNGSNSNGLVVAARVGIGDARSFIVGPNQFGHRYHHLGFSKMPQ